MLLLLTAGWTVIGIPVSYFHVHSAAAWPRSIVLALFFWLPIASVIAYSITRRKREPAAYGFSLRSGGLASLGILAAIYFYLLVSGRLELRSTENLAWISVGALMEEIAFRAVAINILMKRVWDTCITRPVQFSCPRGSTASATPGTQVVC